MDKPSILKTIEDCLYFSNSRHSRHFPSDDSLGPVAVVVVGWKVMFVRGETWKFSKMYVFKGSLLYVRINDSTKVMR